jgi:ABC-type sulfate transport system permease component
MTRENLFWSGVKMTLYVCAAALLLLSCFGCYVAWVLL